MSTQVSIIICTYNRKSLVPRAIDSALAQESVALEVIVVDDCSNDGTLEYLSEVYGDKIKLTKTERNSGVATATNVGFRYSEGKYIALLGDDDYWDDPKKTVKQLELMESNPHLGVTGTWWVERLENGVRVEKKPVLPQSNYHIKERMLKRGGVVCGSTPLVTRNAWNAVGGMDEKQLKGTDSDLFRRIVMAGYGVDLVHEVSTVVDVAHGMNRMTPQLTIPIFLAECRQIPKWGRVWVLYPRAFFFRLKGVIFLLGKLLLIRLINTIK